MERNMSQKQHIWQCSAVLVVFMLKVSQQGNDEMGKLTYIRVQQQESNIHEARMVSSLA